MATLIYIHGHYGSPDEAEHYRPLFPGCEVIGFDYKAQTPWEAEREFAEYFDGLAERGCGSIGIIANSIGAFYAMCALSGRSIAVAYLLFATSTSLFFRKVISLFYSWIGFFLGRPRLTSFFSIVCLFSIR